MEWRDVQNRFEEKFQRLAPSYSGMWKMVLKFQNKGTVWNLHKGNSGRRFSVRVEEKIADVSNHFAQGNATLRKSSQILNISKASINRILKKNLKMYPFKIQKMFKLTDDAKDRRLIFAHHFLNGMVDELPKIWFSDEAHFYLSGHLNKQNRRIWAGNNPCEILEAPHYSQRLTIWCAISNDGIIPVVLYDNVNSDSYREMLEEDFIPKLEELGLLDESWFMQDGARPHTSNENLQFLNTAFGGRVISNRFTINFDSGLEWPPYSPDLNPCDFFLWGYLKDRVFVADPQNLEELEDSILHEIENIPTEMLRKTVSSLPKRLQLLIEANGGHVRT